MTEEELNSVAERLEVVLSADYRQAALSEARINGIDPGIYFVQDAKEILILNLEVRSFSWWPNQLLCIGFDGCGNFMGIDSSGSVRFLDHETGEFGKNAETIPAYFDWLAPIFKYAKPPLVRDNYRVTHQEPPEFDFIEYAYIARSTVVRESVLNPIARLEWTDFVKASSDFKMREYRIVPNPFKKERRCKSRFRDRRLS